MSKGNVFKLSGNMALGGGADYGGVDIDQIKNSLKLLKSKKNQRQSGEQPMGNYGYGGSSASTKNSGYQKSDYNYEALTKNHMPSSQKDAGYNYGSYNNEYSQPKGYGNKRQTDPYDYSNKPPSYPQQNNNRNRTNQPQYAQTYDEYPGYSEKKIGKASNQQTKATEQSYNYSREDAPRQVPRQPSKQQQYEPEPPRQQQRQPPRQQPRQQMQYYNDKQQRSIKEVNRQNRTEIIEYNPADLKECDTCGRKFNPDSIGKHKKVCKKVFVQKRKQFNALQQRIVDNNQKKLMKRGQLIEKKIQAEQKNQKLPKWKAESLAFRAGLKQNRNQQIDPKEAAMLQQAQNQTGVKCPHCGRKFNDNAGPRHIKFCQEQMKKNMMKKKK